jgi:hypothetical protein
MKSSRLGAFCLGIVARPVGAFCFGVCESLIYSISRARTGESIAPGDMRFMPLALGAGYAFFSIVSAFVVFLIPLAILKHICSSCGDFVQSGQTKEGQSDVSRIEGYQAI